MGPLEIKTLLLFETREILIEGQNKTPHSSRCKSPARRCGNLTTHEGKLSFFMPRSRMGEWNYNFTYLRGHEREVSCQFYVLVALPAREEPHYQISRRLVGPQNCYGIWESSQCQESNNDFSAVQHIAKSLHRLRCHSYYVKICITVSDFILLK
jgi:hypothetical protein